MTTDHIVKTDRLLLIPMTPRFLEACLVQELVTATDLLGATVPAVWLEEAWLMHFRLEQLRADPGLQPWLLRAIVQRESNEMVGHIGFHGYPGAAYLQEYAPDAGEMGYTIFPSHRRQGYAREAADALGNDHATCSSICL